MPIAPLAWFLTRAPEPTPIAEPSAAPAKAAAPSATPSPEPSIQDLAPIEIPSVKKPHAAPVKTFKPDCNPPFYYENGIKKFKANCL